MDKLRLRFEKTGRAIYISHLDLMAVMQRGFARADLPLKFSEGFNPHPQISILLPLSVGTASVCELMDFRLREERELNTLPERLTAVLPDGIKALEAYEAERKSAQLKWLEIEGFFEYDSVKPTANMLDDFFSLPCDICTTDLVIDEIVQPAIPAPVDGVDEVLRKVGRRRLGLDDRHIVASRQQEDTNRHKDNQT